MQSVSFFLRFLVEFLPLELGNILLRCLAFSHDTPLAFVINSIIAIPRRRQICTSSIFKYHKCDCKVYIFKDDIMEMWMLFLFSLGL